MLKKIDNLGRIVIPDVFRKELGVSLDEYVEMNKKGNEIVISKVNNMMNEEAIRCFYENWQKTKTDSEYDRGFDEAIKFILGKGN